MRELKLLPDLPPALNIVVELTFNGLTPHRTYYDYVPPLEDDVVFDKFHAELTKEGILFVVRKCWLTVDDIVVRTRIGIAKCDKDRVIEIAKKHMHPDEMIWIFKGSL